MKRNLTQTEFNEIIDEMTDVYRDAFDSLFCLCAIRCGSSILSFVRINGITKINNHSGVFAGVISVINMYTLARDDKSSKSRILIELKFSDDHNESVCVGEKKAAVPATICLAYLFGETEKWAFEMVQENQEERSHYYSSGLYGKEDAAQLSVIIRIMFGMLGTNEPILKRLDQSQDGMDNLLLASSEDPEVVAILPDDSTTVGEDGDNTDGREQRQN